MSNRSDRTQATLFLLEAQFIHAGPVLLLPFPPISPCCLLEAVLRSLYILRHSSSTPWHFVFHIYLNAIFRLKRYIIHKRTIIRLTRISVIFFKRNIRSMERKKYIISLDIYIYLMQLLKKIWILSIWNIKNI